MREPTPAADRGRKLLTVAKLLPRIDVEEAELHHHLVALHRNRADNQRLRVDRGPVGIGHGRVERAKTLDMGVLRDLAEKAGAAQVRADHAGNIGSHAARITRFGDEAGQRVGQGLDHTIGDLDPQRAVLGETRHRSQDQGRKGRHHHTHHHSHSLHGRFALVTDFRPPAHHKRRSSRGNLPIGHVAGHRILIFSGLKTISISRQ